MIDKLNENLWKYWLHLSINTYKKMFDTYQCAIDVMVDFFMIFALQSKVKKVFLHRSSLVGHDVRE